MRHRFECVCILPMPLLPLPLLVLAAAASAFSLPSWQEVLRRPAAPRGGN